MKVGDRIELVSPLSEEPDPIPVGTKGTVDWFTGKPVDLGDGKPFFQIGVKWDNGRTLMLCSPPDQYRVLEK